MILGSGRRSASGHQPSSPRTERTPKIEIGIWAGPRRQITSWCSLGGAVTNARQSASSHGSVGKAPRFLPPDQTRPPHRRRRVPDETKCPNWRGIPLMPRPVRIERAEPQHRARTNSTFRANAQIARKRPVAATLARVPRVARPRGCISASARSGHQSSATRDMRPTPEAVSPPMQALPGT